MFLLLGKREEQQQQQQQHQHGGSFLAEGDNEFDTFWDMPTNSAATRRQQQQQQRKPKSATAQQYYPDNHPIHPEDKRLNVKWPAKRETRNQRAEAALQQPQPAGPSQHDAAKSREAVATGRTAELDRLGHRRQVASKSQPLALPPPPPPLHQQQQQQQHHHLRQSVPYRSTNQPYQSSPPIQQPHQLQQPYYYVEPEQQQPPQQQPPLADQHLHRLFEEIYALRGEAETVQFKYRQERDAWAYENAALQARLADLTDRLDKQAGAEASYAEELDSLRSENRELRIRMQEEQLARAVEAEEAATAARTGGGKGGDPATQQQVDRLMNELAALKRDLERLQHRYRTERDRWSARRRELEKAIDDLVAGKDPKTVQKRLQAAAAAAAETEEPPLVASQRGYGPAADDDDLATATMAYYSSANAVKKEKAILELELEDEKRKNRVLEIEVEVLRDQVMRANRKGRGLADDAEDVGVGGGGHGGAGGVGGNDVALEKGSVEASEKRLDARRASEMQRIPDRSDPYAAAAAVEQKQQQQQQQQKQATLQQKLADTREELKTASEERDQAKAEAERLKAENERRREESKRMRDELARAGEEEEKAKEDRRRDAEEKARLQEENRELKDKLDRLRRENDDELDKLRQEKRKLEEKLRHIKDKMADGQKNYKHFQGEFEELAKLCEN